MNVMNVKEMIGGCIVCGEEQISDENSLIYCDGPCGHGFHQACYGVVEIPSGDWICRLCEFSVSQPKCELCPSTFGGFKPTGNKKWAHVICGLFLPEITFGDKTLMEPIILDGIHSEIFKKSCILCKTASDASYGACVTCSHPSCKTSFHVTCGQAEGLLVEETVKSKNNPSDPGTTYFVAYCSTHLHKQEHVAKNRANLSNMTYSYRIMPKIKLKDQLTHKSSSLNLSSASSATSSAPPSPASTKKKLSSGRSATKADRESKSSSKDSRNNIKSFSKKSALDSSSSFSPFTNGSAASLTENLPLSFSSEHSVNKSSSNKLESFHRKSNKHKLENDSPSAKHSNSISKPAKMDNTLSPFDISAKHRIVSPSTSSVNQPPRKRHHSDSSSSSSSDDSSDNSDSESSSSSSSSSSSNHSRSSNRSRKSNTSRSSSEDNSRPNSSCSSHSEEEVEKNKAKKVSKKSQQIISETIHDPVLFPKTTAATSKKAKQPTDSAISSNNNTSSESLHSSSIDKNTNGRIKSDFFSDKSKALKPAKQSRTNITPTKKNLSHKSSASSLDHTSSTKLSSSSDSKSMSLLRSDGSDDETLKNIKRVKKPQKASKAKKSANASSGVSSNRSSKKITSNEYVISGSSDESSDEKCPSDASDDEKLKYKSEDDSDNDFELKKKSAKMPYNKKSTTEKKPKAVARSRTASSSSSRKKSVSDESKPINIPAGRRNPVKKEMPQASANTKGKLVAKEAPAEPPLPAPTRARRTSSSRSPAKGRMKISIPPTADLKPDVEKMETDPVFVGESDSNTMSSPLRLHGGTMKAAPFVVNHSRVLSPSVNDDSTMSSVLSPSHSYRSSFMSPSCRSTMEHSGLNIHIPVKSGTTIEPHAAASQRISPRIAAHNVAKTPSQVENLLVPKTIEEFIEFQTVNTTNFLLSREENSDIAAMMRHLNSLIQENSQTEKNIESLSKELNCLMTLNKELKSVEITSTSINSQRSQVAELANGVNGEALGRSRALTGTSGIGSMITTPSISSSEMDSQSSCSMPTANPTTFTSILNSKTSATPTPTLISSLNSVTPLAPTTTTANSMIYSSSSHQPLSTATLQNSNTSMANILAANHHFTQHGQVPYNQPFVLNSSHATNASNSRSRQGEIILSASSASLFASSGVHHQQPQQQQVAPLSNHPHSQVGGGHPLTNLANPAILNQLNQLATSAAVPTNALRHSSYQQLMGTSAPYEQQQQHATSNGGNISSRQVPLTRRNSGNLNSSFNNHHSMSNGVGAASTTSGNNRPYENSLSHVSTNGGPNSSHFYNRN